MNLPTIIIAGIVAAIFIAIVVFSYRGKKKGGSACSRCGGCAGCPMSGSCHR